MAHYKQHMMQKLQIQLEPGRGGVGLKGGGGNKWLNGGNTMLQEEMTQPIPKWNSEWIVLAFSCQ